MSQNAFERILSRLEDADPVTEKTAAVNAPTQLTSEEAMLATVRKVAEATKTAAVTTPGGPTDPVTSLETMAKTAADRENELLMKTAENMGAVICDSFFARMAQYDSALNQFGVKTASASPDAVKQAADAAYKQAQADMEKSAEEAFKAGYDDTIQHIYKTAAEIHYAGQTVANQLLQESAK
jgi:hypothetical protein